LKATAKVPVVLLMDTMAGVGFLPERYVDISDVIQTKRDMLLCHQSQNEWLKNFGHVEYLELIDVCCRYRGLQCGVRFAEGFQTWKVWLGQVPEPILP
jgi:LmbE family N-acetylglucosaminyl deacetylase